MEVAQFGKFKLGSGGGGGVKGMGSVGRWLGAESEGTHEVSLVLRVGLVENFIFFNIIQYSFFKINILFYFTLVKINILLYTKIL